jgi:hypothetical protein
MRLTVLSLLLQGLLLPTCQGQYQRQQHQHVHSDYSNVNFAMLHCLVISVGWPGPAFLWTSLAGPLWRI